MTSRSAPSSTARSARTRRTHLLLHPVEELIAYISRVMTLLPGDVILTGTPAGVGPMSSGQQVSVTVEGIGSLTNPVQAR